MEGDTAEKGEFDFLSEPQVQKHFIELNIELLRGMHILSNNSSIFAVLTEFEEELIHYYNSLYGLNLEKRNHDGVTYFYLDFPSSGKSKLNNPLLYLELDGRNTLVAFVLTNFYFSNYFSFDKQFRWDDLRYEIEYGEHKESFQGLFFKNVGTEHTDREWETVKRLFRKAIKYFNRIGFVEVVEETEDIQFTILPTIYRFIDLYKNEFENIDEFLNKFKVIE